MNSVATVTSVCCLAFALLAGCQKESEPLPTQPQTLIPIFDSGDTIRNDDDTSYEELNVVIDSASGIGFKLTSEHSYDQMQSSVFFIRIQFDFQEKIRFLNQVANGGYVFSGPILSAFEYGDTIHSGVASEGVFDWYPGTEAQTGNTGWLKYHIYTPQGATTQNVEMGENYFVFRFGDTGNERIGWVNIVYQDSLCYLKEGFYESTPNQGIIVGE